MKNLKIRFADQSGFSQILKFLAVMRYSKETLKLYETKKPIRAYIYEYNKYKNYYNDKIKSNASHHVKYLELTLDNLMANSVLAISAEGVQFSIPQTIFHQKYWNTSSEEDHNNHHSKPPELV